MFGLSFLNPLLLLGTLASLIPLLIHFLTKKEPQLQVFSSLRFLKEAAEKVQQRWRLRNFLLLFLRMLIVFLLALLFARPAITRSTLAKRRNIAIIIDNSPSMAYISADKSRFDQAREMARGLLEGAGGNSLAIVTTLLGEAENGLTAESSTENLMEKIEEMRLGRSRGDFWEVLQRVDDFAGKQGIKLEEVYFLTDRQSVVYGRRDAYPREKQPLPVVVLLAGEETYRNAAVLDLKSRTSLHFVGLPENFSTELGYWSSPFKTRANVLTVSIDENKILQTRLDLQKNKTTRNFNHAFTKEGQHKVTVQLEDDGLLLDNHKSLYLDVKPRPRALMIGRSDTVTAANGTYYLKKALTASFSPEQRLIDLLVIPPEKLSTHILGNFNLIIYADLLRMTRSERILLEDYTAAGGSLLLFPHRELDLIVYNDELFGANRRYQGFLPARLKERKRPQAPLKLLVEDWGHPLFESLATAEETVFNTASYYEYLSLSGDFSPGVTVLARYTDQSAALLEKNFGKGRVVFCSTVLGGDWNNLVASPEFLPLIFQLTYYLSSPSFEKSKAGGKTPGEAEILAVESDLTMITLKELQQKFPAIDWHFSVPEKPPKQVKLTTSRKEIDLPLLLLIIVLLILEAFLTHRPEVAL